MRTKFGLDYTHASLEWKVAIPVCFEKDIVSLAEEVEAQVIPLLPVVDLVEDRSQVSSVSPVSVKNYIYAASLPPTSFYTNMTKLVERSEE